MQRSSVVMSFSCAELRLSVLLINPLCVEEFSVRGHSVDLTSVEYANIVSLHRCRISFYLLRIQTAVYFSPYPCSPPALIQSLRPPHRRSHCDANALIAMRCSMIIVIARLEGVSVLVGAGNGATSNSVAQKEAVSVWPWPW